MISKPVWLNCISDFVCTMLNCFYLLHYSLKILLTHTHTHTHTWGATIETVIVVGNKHGDSFKYKMTPFAFLIALILLRTASVKLFFPTIGRTEQCKFDISTNLGEGKQWTQTSCHHHHHVSPSVRISLTLFRHPSLSSIASGRSSELHPISTHSCCM